MATGFTYYLTENDNVPLKHFAMKCARGFGPMIHMRDYDMDGPIPDDLGFDNSYHLEGIARAQDKITELTSMTKGEYIHQAQQKIQDSITEYEKGKKNSQIVSKRLIDMIQQVSTWVPPSPEHEGLKQFMLDQLTSTLDMEVDESWWTEQIEQAKNTDLTQRYEHELSVAKRDLQYHTEKAAEDDKHKEWAINWVRQLQASL
jgi:hypothetical protein